MLQGFVIIKQQLAHDLETVKIQDLLYLLFECTKRL